MLRLGIIGLIAVLLTGCAFDDDIRFHPATIASFLLLEHNGVSSVIKIDNQSAIFSYESLIGESPGAITDIAGQDGDLWVSVWPGNTLLKVDPATDQVKQSVSTAPLVPHLIGAGENTIMVADTGAGILGYYLLKKEKWVYDTLDQISGPVLYFNQKFYLGLAATEVGIFSEKALTQIQKIDFQNRIEWIDADNRGRIFVHTRADSILSRGQIDFNGDVLAVPEAEVSYEKNIYTPYRERPLGKEYARDIILTDGKLNIPGRPLCDDAVADFFESVVYLVWGDTLYLRNINTQKNTVLGAIEGNFQKAEHFIDQIP